MTVSSQVRSFLPSTSLIVAFALGLAVGPFLSGYAGLTVSTRSAGARLHDGTLELKASLCEAQARNEVAEPGKLDTGARRELATKFAATQSSGAVDNEIVSLCSNKLAA